jgi:hypothetical protein
MVALVALDAVAARKADLDELVVVSEVAASFATPLYSNVGPRAGEILTVRELVMATLISSGIVSSYSVWGGACCLRSSEITQLYAAFLDCVATASDLWSRIATSFPYRAPSRPAATLLAALRHPPP